MEAYRNPKMLKAPNDREWDIDKLIEWCDSAQQIILEMMKELHLLNNEKAYNLAKNLWYNGNDEVEIRKQLSKYATLPNWTFGDKR